MKRSTLKFFLSLAAVASTSIASADIVYDYNSGLGTFSLGGATWDSALGAMRIEGPAAGGFTWITGAMGQGTDGANWTPINTAISSGTSQFSFDVIVNDDTFTWWNGGNAWYKLGFGLAWNQSISAADGITVNGAPMPGDSWGSYVFQANAQDFVSGSTMTYHVVVPAAAVQAKWNAGWADWEVSLNQGAGDAPGEVFAWSVAIDNVMFTTVPEPSTIALLGLGAVAFLARRRS
jgi:hypothetical protein